MNATARSGQNAETAANPSPVAVISKAAPSSRACGDQRWPTAPTARVAMAEPASVAVLRKPTSNWSNPSASKYAGSNTAT